MEGRVLSAAELVLEQGNKNVKLPTLGDKINQPCGSEKEQEEIQTKLNTVKSLLSVPLVSQRSQVSEAKWILDKGLALVHKPCGKHWDILGHFVNDQLHLNSEEALYLLESNSLELTLNDMPMSIQQGYDILLGSDCSLDEYRTYAHLVQHGYKVIRHQGDLGINQYEGRIRLDQYRTKKRKNDRSFGTHSKTPKVIDLVEETSKTSDNHRVIDLEDDIVTIHDEENDSSLTV